MRVRVRSTVRWTKKKNKRKKEEERKKTGQGGAWGNERGGGLFYEKGRKEPPPGRPAGRKGEKGRGERRNGDNKIKIFSGFGEYRGRWGGGGAERKREEILRFFYFGF